MARVGLGILVEIDRLGRQRMQRLHDLGARLAVHDRVVQLGVEGKAARRHAGDVVQAQLGDVERPTGRVVGGREVVVDLRIRQERHEVQEADGNPAEFTLAVRHEGRGAQEPGIDLGEVDASAVGDEVDPEDAAEAPLARHLERREPAADALDDRAHLRHFLLAEQAPREVVAAPAEAESRERGLADDLQRGLTEQHVAARDDAGHAQAAAVDEGHHGRRRTMVRGHEIAELRLVGDEMHPRAGG